MQKWMLLLLLSLVPSCQKEGSPTKPEESDGTGRVKVVQNGLWLAPENRYDSTASGRTVVTADGELLRGGTLWCFCFHPDKVKYAQTFAAWQRIKDHHLNAVRLALNHEEPDKLEGNPEGEPFRWTLEQYLVEVDRWVDWGGQLGLYVILDHHEVGTHTQEWLRTFWTAAAPRYADREHVIYEIANEPVAWHPEDYTDQDIADFLEIYQIMQTHAPQTHVIFLSFAVPDPGMAAVADKLTGVNWNNASVAFHGYWTNTSAHIQALKTRYPVINTEFMSYQPDHGPANFKMDGYLWQTQVMEKSRISWFIWDAAYRADHVESRLKPMIEHAENNGYQWW
jgi:hypothetical protein